jgi:hypothetical protein
MSSHAYPLVALAADYARAAAGIAILLPAPLILDLDPVVEAILLGLAALFLAYGGRTLLRHLRVVEVNQAGLARSGPFPARIEWQALDDVALAYYATARDGRNGWMQLVLRGGGRRVRLDSRIEGFRAIVGAAAKVAARRGLSLSPTTSANLAALGLAEFAI